VPQVPPTKARGKLDELIPEISQKYVKENVQRGLEEKTLNYVSEENNARTPKTKVTESQMSQRVNKHRNLH
jgi:response regulator of citrate/malate metabolism